MNWRKWLRDAVVVGLNGKLPETAIYASGSLDGKPGKKFAVVRIGNEDEDLADGGAPVATSWHASVWVHDDSGSYDFIDGCLVSIKAALVGQVSGPGGIACVWEGDSGELADDFYKTLTRNTNYRLVGRVA